MFKNILIGSTLILSACEAKNTDIATPKEPENKAVGSAYKTPNYDINTAIAVVKSLSSDDFEGRAVDSVGGAKARAYLKTEIAKLNVFPSIQEQNFSFSSRGNAEGKSINGVNLIGTIDGKTPGQGPILLITAHYDHLGTRNGKVYNGADDNASGSGALFAITQSFASHAPKHDVQIIWLDGEERGLQGAHAVVKSGALNGRAVFNLNLDMIGQSTKNELYASGIYHTPTLKPFMKLAAIGTGLNLSFGHDRPEQGANDWTSQSDHGVFHNAGIPYIYFGVEDHPYYHKPTDTFEVFPVKFYEKSIKTIVNAAHILDENLQDLAKPAK